MAAPTFQNVPDRVSFPEEEVNTLKYWREIDAFQESLRQSKGKPVYTFYDGPPFATGLPHYGHILAGTIKDVITRHYHQRGFHVERRFGWDCHGVPVEGIIDEKLKIKGRGDVLKMGIAAYNEECRSIVQMYVQDWRNIVERFGRWIDFDNDYKTMDLNYMESTWWVFKQMFDKGMVYRAFRVIAYSTALATPLSNFEAADNYKEVSDPSIIIQFKRTDTQDSWILAWTTTPWTLPSNLALCVGPELKYLRVRRKEDNHEFIVGKDRWAWVCSCIKKDPEIDFELLEEVLGETLVGITYEPVLPYFKGTGKVNEEKCWRVLSDSYVTTEAGTCVVHQAPAYGEDDNRVCKKYGIVQKDGTGMVDPVDCSGCFTEAVWDFQGQHVKEADKGIKEMLKKKGNLMYNGTEVHKYPHCWRSDTPLIYKAVPAWFINVEEIREKLIKNNNETYWVPAFVKEKRFHNWLQEARDWCVSRSRYWGTPLPIWVSEDFEEVVCVGSIAELEQYAGRKITDMHRHFIDDIKIPSKMGKGMLSRVDEVFDCWFESGSMPYAQKHYPFENKEEFESSFPANFIAEGLDQTRGWFYSLMVLSTIIFDKPPWKNLIVNGLVLAADGKKMSKRLKNYPDPLLMCEQYGADAVRMYMCNSPVVRAEPLKFKEEGVKDVVKDVFLPWYNAYRFLVQEATRYESDGKKFVPDSGRIKTSTNFMDKWINTSTHNLIKFVREEMEAYRLYTVVGGLTRLLEDLTNWYVRLNRDRMRGNSGPEEALTSLCTLYDVLLTVTIMLAPITPFITEMIYRNLARALPDGHPQKVASVHFLMVPDYDKDVLDMKIQTAVQRMQSVVELGRTCREQNKVGLKTPLKSLTLYNDKPDFVKDIQLLQTYVEEELNVMEVLYRSDMENIAYVATLNFKVLGKKLGKSMKDVQEAVKDLTQEQLAAFEKEGKITICGFVIEGEEMSCSKKVKNLDDPNLQAISDDQTMIVMDFTPDEELGQMALCRDVANRVQKLRKEAGLLPDDPVDMWAEVVEQSTVEQGKVEQVPIDPTDELRTAIASRASGAASASKKGKKVASSGQLAAVLENKAEYLNKLLRRQLWSGKLRQGHEPIVKQEDFDIDGAVMRVSITKRTAFFDQAELRKLGGTAAEEVPRYLASISLDKLTEMSKNGVMDIKLGSASYSLKLKTHYVLGPCDAPWLQPK